MRGYAGIITGVAAAMISFDVAWNTTQMALENCLAWSFFIGLAVTLVFIYAVELLERPKKPEKRCAFIEEDGLSVMVQRSSRRRAA